MSSIKVRCPSCGNEGSAPEKALGKRARCKRCGQPFTVAREAAAPVSSQPQKKKPRRRKLVPLLALVALIVAGAAGAAGWMLYQPKGSPPPDTQTPIAKADIPAGKPTAKTSPVEKPVTPAAEKPADPPAEKPSTTPAAKPADPPAEKPSTTTAAKPADPPAEKPVTPAAEKPADLPAEKPVTPPAGKPVTPLPPEPAATDPGAKPIALANRSSDGLLPTYQRESTDPTLPGTWHIIDRTKPIRKLVDCKSLFPVGPKTLAMLDYHEEFLFEQEQDITYLFDLPGDIGDEHLLLGCLSAVETMDGARLPHEVTYYQSSGPVGDRLVEVRFHIPAHTRVRVSIKAIMLLPPILSYDDSRKITLEANQRQATGDFKARLGVPGFPDPEFKSGGLGFVGATRGPSDFVTVQNILKASSQLIQEDWNDEWVKVIDPDTAKSNGRGACLQRSRVVEKSLFGIARARVILCDQQDTDKEMIEQSLAKLPKEEQDQYRDNPTIGHAVLIIEDPSTGKYFIGDYARTWNPGKKDHLIYMGPLRGDLILHGGIFHDYNVPDALVKKGLRISGLPKTAPKMWVCKSNNLAKATSDLSASSGSSRCGRLAEKYQKWLQGAPADFRELERTLGKGDVAAPLAGNPPAPPEKDALDSLLPTYQRKSTDPALPGTWYILDRSKPIRKIVDGKSLFPVGPKSLMMLEISGEFTSPIEQKITTMFPLPADVGDEHLLLGCLPMAVTDDGASIPVEAVFYQSRGPVGQRVAVLTFTCPAQKALVYSLKEVLLLPRILTTNEALEAAQKTVLQKGTGSFRERLGKPGFPDPEFKTGGPEYVGAPRGSSDLETVQNVLRASHLLVASDWNPRWIREMNPDAIKVNRKGACMQYCRVAEKSLSGVARARFVFCDHEEFDPGMKTYALARMPTEAIRERYRDYPAIGHALLLIEDPKTGSYFFADYAHCWGGPANRFVYMGPHCGNAVIYGGFFQADNVPPALTRKDYYFTVPAQIPPELIFHKENVQVKEKTATSSLSAGSSRCGRLAEKYQKWLEKIPEDFRALERQLVPPPR